MMALSERKDPVIAFGTPEPVAARYPRQIIRAPRMAPNGTLTRTIRREQARKRCEALCRSMALSEPLSTMLSAEMLGEVGGDDGHAALERAFGRVFDFEPIAETTPQPLILVGATAPLRRRVALAMAQRMEWAGRRAALYCLRDKLFPTPLAIHSGGLDVLHVGSVGACIDAATARDQDDLAIIDASCLDGDEARTNALAMLALALDAEIVYVADPSSPFPDQGQLARVERLILAGRYAPERFGAILEHVHAQNWAFAGQYSLAGIYRPVTPESLVDRLAFSAR